MELMSVVNLNRYRLEHSADQKAWEAALDACSKADLLKLLVEFRKKKEVTGLSNELIVRGIPLFKRLAYVAQTEAFRGLMNAYMVHLEGERDKIV